MSEIRQKFDISAFENAFEAFLEQADKNAISKKAEGGQVPFGFNEKINCDGANIATHYGQGGASTTPFLNWGVVSIYYTPENGNIDLGIESDRFPSMTQMKIEPLQYSQIGNKKVDVAIFYSTSKTNIDFKMLYDKFLNVCEEVIRIEGAPVVNTEYFKKRKYWWINAREETWKCSIDDFNVGDVQSYALYTANNKSMANTQELNAGDIGVIKWKDKKNNSTLSVFAVILGKDDTRVYMARVSGKIDNSISQEEIKAINQDEGLYRDVFEEKTGDGKLGSFFHLSETEIQRIIKLLNEKNPNLPNDFWNFLNIPLLEQKYSIPDNKGEKKVTNSAYELNTILYGPPGTGKTYNTAKIAVEICDGDAAPNLDNYDEVMERYNALRASGRIAFVTFHQSYGYEEFIEGIKPVMDDESETTSDDQSKNNKGIKYDVIPGVFKNFCDEARKTGVSEATSKDTGISENANIWKATIRDQVKQDCFDNNRVRIDWYIGSEGAKQFVEAVKKGDIIITTNKSRTKIHGIAVVDSDQVDELETDGDATSRSVRWLAKDINEDITAINKNKILHRMTFARVPNMQVSDIVALAKELNKNDITLAKAEISESKKPYVFIIDEINRGNISKIFGELITLIEDTKREGMTECIPAILPYSGEQFSVPQNVYILGTMNTADRSIALMDTALRRRFSFVEKMPNSDLLSGISVTVGDKSVDIKEMLDTINQRIEFLFDREHTIGHAFFMKLKKTENCNITILASIFKKSVIPLLQEYFYEDYEKIRLILGDTGKDKEYQFITSNEVKPSSLFRGGNNHLEKLVQYRINCTEGQDAFMEIESYIGIMEPKKIDDATVTE